MITDTGNITPNTDKAITGKIGDQTISLKADSSAVVEAPRSDKGDYPVILNYLIEGKDDPYAICETQWQHNPASRAVVIVSSNTGRILLLRQSLGSAR